MFRLDISHLQAPTLTLPDALSTLGSHSVYMWITYLIELLEYTGQLPKWPHRGHNTVNKNSAKQRQNPREDIHINSVEQDQPQGIKNREITKYSKSY